MDYSEFKTNWRNMGQLEYMFKEEVKHVNYTSELGDHEHCEFCSEKISVSPDDIHEGYYTIRTKHRYWICPKCFEDFKEIFQWSLIN